MHEVIFKKIHCHRECACYGNQNENVDHPAKVNYINPSYGLSLVDTLWNASSYRQPLEQEGNPMT